MDLIDTEDETPRRNEPEYTVAEISGAIKKTLEGTFGRIRVRGEVGRVVRASSGHLYYDLKDDRGVLSCNTWKGQVPGLGVQPEEGLEVIVTGKVSSYGPQSRYNMIVDSIEVAGEGALMAMLEKRRKALAAEGLFDQQRKQALPFLPEVIGVVTSLQGAVIRDILHRLRDRFPRKVLIWPVAVQGENCAPQVSAAIKGFNALTPGGALPRPDLLIVARGGGSLEDLWGFNEEVVVRAAAASDIPLISAVGHETDTTLIDFAADQRAPTPTAAAELAVPVRLELMASLDSLDSRLSRSRAAMIESRRQRLADLSRALPRPDELLRPCEQRLDAALARLPSAWRAVIQTKSRAFERTGAQLRSGLLVQHTKQLKARVDKSSDALMRVLNAALARQSAQLDAAAALLTARPLQRAQRDMSDRLTRLLRDLRVSIERQIERDRTQLASLDRLHSTLSYTATLARGYALVWDAGTLVSSAEQAAQAGALELEFKDGRFATGGTQPGPGRGTGRRKPASKGPTEQKSLFDD
ncbi:MAG: exodeoxyribonuclease VII large subunit [Pseudomonadota bacterium]